MLQPKTSDKYSAYFHLIDSVELQGMRSKWKLQNEKLFPTVGFEHITI